MVSAHRRKLPRWLEDRDAVKIKQKSNREYPDRLSPQFSGQKNFLAAESVAFKTNGDIDMKTCAWGGYLDITAEKITIVIYKLYKLYKLQV